MERLDDVRARIRDFVAQRGWEPFHDPKNLAMAVVSEAGELAAELRWTPNAEADAFCATPEARARISDEIADVLITTVMLAERVGVDPVEVMLSKLEKNALKYPVSAWKDRYK